MTIYSGLVRSTVGLLISALALVTTVQAESPDTRAFGFAQPAAPSFAKR